MGPGTVIEVARFFCEVGDWSLKAAQDVETFSAAHQSIKVSMGVPNSFFPIFCNTKRELNF